MLSENGVPERPLFYLPNLKGAPNSNITNIFSSSPSEDSGQTLIFNVKYSNEDELIGTLALLSVEEAETKLVSKMALEFYLCYVKEPSNMVKLEKCSKHDQLVIKPNLSLKDASWDDFGTNDLEFRKGNGPVCVSNWIGSVSSGLVMAIPKYLDNHDQGVFEVNIIVRIPN